MAHRAIPNLAAVVLVTLTLAACDTAFFGDGEQGSGNLVTETRSVAGFDGVEVSSAVNLDLVVDPGAAHSVVVTYDDNILDNVITRVSNGVLIVELEGSLNLSGNVDRVVEVVTPQLVVIEASGASSVKATGPVTSLELGASGASSIDLDDLDLGDVTLDVSGASSVALTTEGSVRGSVSGASSVVVSGNPVAVDVDVSGASSLIQP
ncbi:MAG: DUF2807 domain-containing protein [Acidimicrobiia bacterium]|nr:DUF2807 domain-containing protein [Acidimicrobiia bacterium]